jgi:tetratricopeptide (TPR) repeat protein
MGQLDEASKYYRRALSIREELARGHPEEAEFLSDIGGTLRGLARLEMMRNRLKEARELFELSIIRYRRALVALPREPTFLLGLRRALTGLAEVHLALGKSPEAALAARELAAISRGSGAELYDAACIWARCGAIPAGGRSVSDDTVPHPEPKEKAYADQAMDALRQAVAAGWTNARHTSDDQDLMILRDRADFRRLMGELLDRGFPVNPFAN